MLKNDWWKSGMGLLTVIGMVIFGGLRGQAASNQMPANGTVGFSVAAQLPKNQRNANHSFFDLAMRMGQTQRLQVTIRNSTNRDIQVKSAIHTASTNPNGIIEYAQNPDHYDASLKYRFGELTKLVGPSEVTIPANGSKVVSADVKLPAGEFQGVLLGGWYFQLVDQKATGVVKGATNVTSKYSYVIGMRYTVGQVPNPELKLANVKPEMLNGHHGIFPHIRNVQPAMLMGVDVQTQITRKRDGKVVRSAHKTDVQFAPNSEFRYPLLAGHTPLSAGEYHLHMVAKSRAHRWVFDRDFSINWQTAQHYNHATVDTLPKSPWWLLGVGAAGMLAAILAVWLFVAWRRKRPQPEDEVVTDE